MLQINAAKVRAALLFSLPFAFALSGRPAAAQVTITAQISGTPPLGSVGANADIQNSLNSLASDFQSAMPFNMTAAINWEDLGSGVLGGSEASSSMYQTHNGVLYIDPLDRYLYGAASAVVTTGGYVDFTINLNNKGVAWDYTQATPASGGATSLVSVVYHEAIHSMGFGAFNNQNGSYEFSNKPTLWTTHLYDAYTSQSFTADTTSQRQVVMVSGDSSGNNGDLLFVGASEEAQNGGKGVSMYAPSTFQLGSSDGSHIAENQIGGELMYPDLVNGVYRTPSPLVLSMMHDIGWQIAAAPEPSDLACLSIGIIATAGLILKARRRRAEG